MIEIAPSILSADFARLADALALLERGGADVVHVDVMDGHFVPNLTIGPPVVAALKRETSLPLDCHLMITDADRWVETYAQAGAARITVHVEACPHLHRTVQTIRACGARPGVSINPATPIETLTEILPDLDTVLVMSVNPGFGGQRFIAGAVDKVARLARLAAGRQPSLLIQVDGGIGPREAGILARAGARSFVAGNAVFGSDDPVAAIHALRAAASEGAA